VANPLIPGISFQVNTLSGGSLTTGLISYWNLQGNSIDLYGPNNGTDTSISYGTTYGKVGQGALFGAASKIDAGAPSSMNFGTGSVSLAAWVKLTSTAQSGFVTKRSNGGSGPEMGFAGGAIQYNYADGLGTNGVFTTQSKQVNDGAWHFVVAVWNRAGSVLQLYTDGVTDGSTALSTTTGTDTAHLIIGYGYYMVGTLNGDIDEVGVWSKALSANEITDLYNGGAGQTMAGNIVDTVSAVDNTPTIEISLLGAISVTDKPTAADKLTEIMVGGAVWFNVTDKPTVGDASVTVRLKDTFSVYDTPNDADIAPTISITGGITTLSVNVYDTDTDTDNLIDLQVDLVDLFVSDVDTNSDTLTVFLPILSGVVVTDIDTGVDTITLIQLNPEQINVYDANTEGESCQVNIAQEGAIFIFDIESTLDSSTIVIPTYLISVSDVDIESESTTIQVPSLGSIVVYDNDVESDVAPTVVLPILNLSVSDIEIDSDYATIVEPTYSFSVSDGESDTDSISNVFIVGQGLFIYDSAIEQESVTIQIPNVGSISLVDTDSGVDTIQDIQLTSYLSVADIDIDTDTIGGLITTPLYIAVSDIDGDNDVVLTVVLPRLNISVSDVDTDSDTSTITIPQVGSISVADIDVSTDTVGGLIITPLRASVSDIGSGTDLAIVQMPTYLIVVSDIEINSDTTTVQVPTLGTILVNDIDSDTDVITNITLNPLEFVVSETQYVNDFPIFEEFSFFTLDEIDIDQDFSSVTIPILLINISDVVTDTDSITILVPTVGAISVSDGDINGDSITVRVPSLGSINVSDVATGVDTISGLIETPLYINVSDYDGAIDTPTILLPILSGLVVTDGEAEQESISIIVQTAGIRVFSVSESEVETDTLQNIELFSYLTIADSEAEQESIDVEVISSLSVFDTEVEVDTLTDIELTSNISVSDIDADSDTAIILIPIYRISVSDYDGVNDFPVFEEFNFFVAEESDIEGESITIVIPILHLNVSDIETAVDTIYDAELISYLSVSDVDSEGEAITIFLLQLCVSVEDAETEQESATTRLISYIDTFDVNTESDVVYDIEIIEEGLIVYDSTSESEEVVVTIPALGNIQIVETNSSQEYVDIEIIDEGLLVYDIVSEQENVQIEIESFLLLISVADTESAIDIVIFEERSLFIIEESDTQHEFVSLMLTPLLFVVIDSDVENEFVSINLPQLLGEFTLQLSFTFNPYILLADQETFTLMSSYAPNYILMRPDVNFVIQNTYNQPSIVLTP